MRGIQGSREGGRDREKKEKEGEGRDRKRNGRGERMKERDWKKGKKERKRERDFLSTGGHKVELRSPQDMEEKKKGKWESLQMEMRFLLGAMGSV